MAASEAGEREVNEREEGSEATGIGNESPDIISMLKVGVRVLHEIIGECVITAHSDERRVTWTLDICLDIWGGGGWIFLGYFSWINGAFSMDKDAYP
mmetsp:Transcript_6326/g.19705  ORF Transcript_6326/g.19705 Transcript_6326/m.19705 type:complete len:97 (+) Transcript_6326:260-550(+)